MRFRVIKLNYLLFQHDKNAHHFVIINVNNEI